VHRQVELRVFERHATVRAVGVCRLEWAIRRQILPLKEDLSILAAGADVAIKPQSAVDPPFDVGRIRMVCHKGSVRAEFHGIRAAHLRATLPRRTGPFSHRHGHGDQRRADT
jgi:hypothetical protein